MPDPRQPDFTSRAADEVIAILERTEGRAFVLFTSYASMHAVRERVARALPYPMLTQGTAPRGVLLETFKRTPNAVLFATSSFWQGVDVVGDALSCVIIDKLPFASPGDPIVAARLEAIAARGGDPFATLQVPLAILTLLQGLGRLLRHREDRGILAILDPRLQTMGYGRRFLASLPPAPITRNARRHLAVHGGDRARVRARPRDKQRGQRARRTRVRRWRPPTTSPSSPSTASISSSGMNGLARKAEPSGSR